MFGRLPTATTTRSAGIRRSWPFRRASKCWSSRPFTSASTLTSTSSSPRRRFSGRFRLASIDGRIRPAASTIVTAAPSFARAVPSSSPMYPAPTTATVSGTCSSASAPVLSTTRAPSTGNTGSGVGDEPVASSKSSYIRNCAPPSPSLTTTVPGSAMRIRPRFTVTFARFSSPATPPARSCTRSSFQRWKRAMSNRTSLAVMPMGAPWRVR